MGANTTHFNLPYPLPQDPVAVQLDIENLAQTIDETLNTTFATKSYANGILTTHESDTTNVHGIVDTSALATKTYADTAVSTHESDTSTHGVTGDIVGTTDAQTLTNKTISGSSNTLTNIANSSLTNSSITINGTSVSLGGSTTVSGSISNALTIGTGLSGTSYNGSSAVTIAIDSTVATLTGSQTLTNKTLTSPVISTISNTGTITLPTSTDTLVGRATTDTLTNKTITKPILLSPQERLNVSATAATGTINFNINTSAVWYYTTNATGNFVINVRGDASTTLNSLLTTGDSITVVFLNTNGSTAYYNTSVQVDGTTSGVTTKWQGGTAPSSGNASSIDAYSYNIIKTANATFTVLASQTRFA